MGEGSRTYQEERAPSASADEQALLDEALRQADERLVASLQRDELRRRRRRWLALGGFAMTITVAAIVASVTVGGSKPGTRGSTDAGERQITPVTGSVPLVDSFETGNETPRGWRKGAPIPGVTYLWDKDTAFEGKASLCLKKTANRYFPIAQWHRTLAYDGTSKCLKVSAQVKARQAKKSIIDALFLDAKDEWIRHQWVSYIGAKKKGDPPADHDWKPYSGTVPIPSGTKKIVIGLQIYGPGTVWFDALEAQYVELGAAVDADLDRKLKEIVAEFKAGPEGTDVWGLAGEIAEGNDARAIPTLIGLIDADNSYQTIYGVGHFGLGKMTGVRYSPYHDGAWWRRWWDKNKSRYPKEVQAKPIPDLPKTENGKAHRSYPEDLDTLDGLLRQIVRQFRDVREGKPRGYPGISHTAQLIGELKDPRAIPTLIGIIDADNTYDTVYGVGYFGLGRLTGVRYSKTHDGAWWRKWWDENKSRFPADVRDATIPDMRPPVSGSDSGTKKR
jgi:hypothetical protein